MTSWSQVNGGRVLVALSRRTSFVRALRLPNVSREDTRQLLIHRAAEALPLPLTEMAFDFAQTTDFNSHGRLTVVAAIRLSDLTKLREELKEAGLRNVRILPVAVGAGPLAAHAGQADGAVVSRVKGGFAIDLVQHGSTVATRQLNQSTEVTSLYDEVGRSYASIGIAASPVIAATGLNLSGTAATVPDSPIDHLFELKGDLAELNIELPSEVNKRATSKEENVKRFSVLALGAAAAATFMSYLHMQDVQKATNSDKAKFAAKLQSAKSRATLEQGKLDDAQSAQQVTDRAFKPAQKLSDVVIAASMLVPDKVWLTGYTVERGKSLQIRGVAMTAESLAMFEKSLASEPRFRSVQLTFANNAMIDKQPVVQFALTAFPVGNLPLVDADKVKS